MTKLNRGERFDTNMSKNILKPLKHNLVTSMYVCINTLVCSAKHATRAPPADRAASLGRRSEVLHKTSDGQLA